MELWELPIITCVKRGDWRGTDLVQGPQKLMAGKEDQSRLLLNVVLPRHGPAPCTWDSSALAVNRG